MPNTSRPTGSLPANPMSPDVRRIPLKHIDPGDITYQISTGREDRLTESIHRIGQLQAIRLIETGGKHIILSGFRRVAACRELGHSDIAARVYPDARLGMRRRCLLAIGDNSAQRVLGAIETARAVTLLHNQLPDADAVRECLHRLLLPENPAWLRQQLALSALPGDIVEMLHSGVIGTAMALELGKLNISDAGALGRVFERLRLGLNRQREVMGICRDLARRDKMSIREILDRPPLRSLIEAADGDIGERTRRLRQQLRKMRYPDLSAAEAEFQRCIKSLALGQGIRLVPPPFFEGNAYQMTLILSSIDDLHRHLTTLAAKASSSHLHRLFTRSGD